MANTMRNLVWARGWLVSVWCRVGAHAAIAASRIDACGVHAMPVAFGEFLRQPSPNQRSRLALHAFFWDSSVP